MPKAAAKAVVPTADVPIAEAAAAPRAAMRRPVDLPDVGQARQDHAQVVAQRGLGVAGIAIGDGGDDLAVLGDHLAEIARLGQAEPADAV